MARKTPVQLVGGAYSDDALPWSAQDCVNYIPVFAEKEGTRSPKMLRGAPGCSLFTADMAEAPIRGSYDCEGLLLAVAGNTLYRIASDGAATSLGTIPGTERVTFAHNQVTGGHQVAIGNGQSGYVYDTSDSSFTQITDEGFPGFRSVDFIDQYIIGVEPFGRYWLHSDLSDATSYNTIDRNVAEKLPDKILQVIGSGSDVFVLGQRSGQFFYNTGASTGTWTNRAGAEMDVGAASPWTACRLDNTIYWLGNDGTVYRLEGYQPRRVSTHALEQAFSRADVAQAYAYTFEDRGHKIYYLTVGGRTWGFDVATGEWHRRKSFGLNFWRFSSLTRHRGRWFGGDYTNGRMYLLDWGLQSEDGAELERSRISPVLHDDQNKVICNLLELVFDSGMDAGATTLLDDLSISGDLPDGEGGDVESYQYESAGGIRPHTFSILSGELPAGLSMNSAGLVTGTRTTAGTYSWVVRVTDADGYTADLSDGSVTSADSTPVLTGTFRMQMNLSSGVTGAALGVVPRGSWKLMIGEVTHASGDLALYADGVLLGTGLKTIDGIQPYDLTVAGTAYGGDDTYQTFRGRLWGVGVANGLLTTAEKAVLYNGGDGISFAALAASADPDAVSLWAKIIYAWQLDNDSASTYVDSKGNKNLTKFGTVGHVIDAKFGRCLNGTKAGRLVAVGSNAQGIESSVSATYFAWVFSEVLSTDDNPGILTRYDGINGVQGLRSYWLSD
jgi:hypothetical protein